jgi:glycosyltransferase involved in cell wall biosynthesis
VTLLGQRDPRIPILYLAPWVDFGGSDKGTIDWFRWIDRERFRPSLVTTQQAGNRRLREVLPYADEVWPLSELLGGQHVPGFILDFIHTRRVPLIHIMNAKVAFDLLPDIACLRRPPAVVVQLHVEEQDRMGYVRYITTRSASLVDAFSVTSHHLAEAVHGYGVPWEKIRVIPTGVDADREFSPQVARPLERVDPRKVNILYPGRLHEQKDPLLMVQVLAGLVRRQPDVHLHVVGDGPLEGEVREAAAARGLEAHMSFHPPTDRLVDWYAACDILLMTSVFEGVPYVVYEAMAMGLPIVAPRLPGNAELMGEGCGQLIHPRDEVGSYVAALGRYAASADERRAVGRESRARVRALFSLERMAAEHGRLYDDLLAARRARPQPPQPAPARPPAEPIRLRGRPSRERPLVSIVVPCFNHGRHLLECLASLRAQTYPELQVIVVDDGSTEAETREVMDRLEAGEDGVELVRMPANSGPSAARNAGLARVRGRYVLPVDADNLLVPDAVERLVEHLREADERVGFVYPNLQFFGNRDDYFQAPRYDLLGLLEGNYADTCSLIDADVFAAGLRYPEEIVHGHEDWDFVLQLAEREIFGEPARGKTLLFRKEGFSRSESVDYARRPFVKEIRRRHRHFFGEGRGAVKGRWAPALSLVALAPVERDSEAGRRLAARFAGQRCQDFELILSSVADWWSQDLDPRIRRLPAGLAETPGGLIDAAIRAARGRAVLLTTGTGSSLLEDRALVEKLLRTLEVEPEIDAVAFTDAGAKGRFPFRLILPEDDVSPQPHAVAWRTDRPALGGRSMVLEVGDEPTAIARELTYRGAHVQWRHWPGPGAPAARRAGAGRREHVRFPEAPQPYRPPAIPRLPAGTVPRWGISWYPPGTIALCRHRHLGGERRLVTNSAVPPPGYGLERTLGAILQFSPPGTTKLVRSAVPQFRAVEPGRPELLEAGDEVLGHLELAPLPLLDQVLTGYHPASGGWTLLNWPDDPLLDEVEELRFLGFVTPFPLPPSRPPLAALDYGIAGLVRAVDRPARRHRYGVGEVPQGEVVGEIGALATWPHPGTIPLLRDPDGWIGTAGHLPAPPPPRLRSAVRWTLAPGRWQRFGHLGARGRAIGRRAAMAREHLRRPPRAEAGAPETVGYLFAEPDAGRIPLYSAIHPVTGDQLLTRHRIEPLAMGYVELTLLGYLLPQAPVTGTLDWRRRSVPWASRFGLEAPWT